VPVNKVFEKDKDVVSTAGHSKANVSYAQLSKFAKQNAIALKAKQTNP
jgi:hypothetical protein